MSTNCQSPRRRQINPRLLENPEVLKLTARVAASYRVPVSAVIGRARGKQVVAARQVSIYLSHVLLSRPMDEIAKMFDRHHSTVSYACHRVEDLRDEPRFDARLARIEGKWEAGSGEGASNGG
jgi:chromosomal replication initiation ATPase DnaA